MKLGPSSAGKVQEEITARVPLGRMGSKWDIAMACTFLASPAAAVQAQSQLLCILREWLSGIGCVVSSWGMCVCVHHLIMSGIGWDKMGLQSCTCQHGQLKQKGACKQTKCVQMSTECGKKPCAEFRSVRTAVKNHTHSHSP
eukprot:1160378-Pelagomonas_calceolata.AAC.4